ncbi:MAG: hypothetical protein J6T86_03240 [Bacteroidales bacterium]|nr:hypothetical protein [Bacteroidales bacterium]
MVLPGAVAEKRHVLPAGIEQAEHGNENQDKLFHNIHKVLDVSYSLC